MQVRVKVCGMTSKEDIELATRLGANALGFILYPKSSRAISIERAKALLSAVPPFVAKVAVLVNPTQAEVEAIATSVDYLQFHGEEDPSFCEIFAKPYIKALPATSREDIVKTMEMYPSAAAFLIDTPSESHGGTGKSFDWSFIPQKSAKPIILAGGLNSENIALAIQTVRPYAVDLCSGLETVPGKKDKAKMRNFFNCIREINYATFETS